MRRRSKLLRLQRGNFSMFPAGTTAGIDAGSAPTVSISAVDVIKASAIGTVYANLQYNTNGTEYENSGRNDNFSTSRGAWLDTGAAADAWVERTINSGSFFSDPGAGRLNLGTTRSFKVRDTDSGSGFQECDFDIDMYDAASGGNNIGSVNNLILRASYTNACPTCCFTPDTLVTMANGSLRPIGELREGELITVLNGVEPITGVIVRTNRPMHTLTFEDGAELNLSEEHPIFIKGKGYSAVDPSPEYMGLTDTQTLAVGDNAVDAVGELHKIVGIDSFNHPGDVFTLENSRFYANGFLVW